MPIADDGDWGGMRLAGRWRLESPEPRFGGLSALRFDRDKLVALSDSGTLIRFAKPGGGSQAAFTDLPSGPGSAWRKAGRDSESLVADPTGHSWWVGFENGHELRHFNGALSKTLEVVSLREFGWPRNRGAEGLVAYDRQLRVFPESGKEFVDITGGRVGRRDIGDDIGRVGDVTAISGGIMLALERSISPFGVGSSIMMSSDYGQNWKPLATLPLGRLANPEGIAAEWIADGIIRLWIVTDNDFRRRVPTELIALDWQP